MSDKVSLTFVTRTGEEVEVHAEVGDTLMSVAQDAGLDVEGACEGNLACATCHVILTKLAFDTLQSPSEEEDDMLELAVDLHTTSRLGCQVEVSSTMQGWVIQLPRQTQNLMGF